jgi:L-ribulose-5-phosphate 3-epimerase
MSLSKEITRRKAIAGIGTALGAATIAAAQQSVPHQDPAQVPRFGRSAPKRTMPMLCGYSQNLVRVPYPQLGDIAAQIGYEGLDLTVMIGGHVDPRITNVDLVRAFEAVRGAGLEVPMISTNITSTSDPTCYPVLYLTGHSQVPLFRLGYWQYGSNPIQLRLAQVRQDLAQILGLAQRCDIAAMFPNRAGGFVGQSVWDAQEIVGTIDPRLVGYYFDPAEAAAEGGAGGWQAALRLALPRLKALSLQDFFWKKEGDGAESWKMQKCPLGQGMVDWDTFFSMVATARFTGPISIHMEYAPQDALGSMAKDLEFARTHLRKAFTAAQDESKS